MKKMIVDPSDVRKWYSEDFLALQDLAASFEAAFAGLGNFIIKGCAVEKSGNTVAVAPGLVMLNGHICTFAGGSAANGALYVKMAVTREQGPYLNGGYLDTAEDYTAPVCGASDEGAFRLDTAKPLTAMLEMVGSGKYVPLQGDSVVNGTITVNNIIIA